MPLCYILNYVVRTLHSQLRPPRTEREKTTEDTSKHMNKFGNTSNKR